MERQEGGRERRMHDIQVEQRRRSVFSLSLEQALEFCSDDECVEVTPGNVRIRKVELSMSEREKYRGRRAKAARED